MCTDGGFSEAIRGFAKGQMGLAASTTDASTYDCYKQADQAATQMNALLESFTNFQISDYMRPVYMTTALMVEMSDQMVACKDSVKLKQLDNRLSTFSGLFNLLFTVGYAFIEGTKNDLYNSMIELVKFSSLSCTELGFNFGKFTANLLEAKSPTEVFYNAVTTTTTATTA